MKKLYLILLLVIFSSYKAQELNEIVLSNKDKTVVITMKIDRYWLTIDTNGQLVNLHESSPSKKIGSSTASFFYNTDAEIDYEDPEFDFKFNRDITFCDDFHDYSKGKLKSINGVGFEYYDGFHSY